MPQVAYVGSAGTGLAPLPAPMVITRKGKGPLTVSSRAVSIALFCGSKTACRGTVSLSTPAKKKGKPATVLGRSSVSIASGGTGSPLIALPSSKKLFGVKRSVTATLTITPDAGAPTTSSVTLRR